MSDHFDESYYERYYENTRTRVASRASTRQLVTFVLHYLRHIQIEINTALDVGCGLGWWQRTLCRHGVHYHGLEYSEYMANRMGWEYGDILTPAERGADLVICQGVLGYIGCAWLPLAIENLHRWTGSALYLSVACEEDVDVSINMQRSDDTQIIRPKSAYAELLKEKFVGIGGGLFLPYSDRSRMTSLEMTLE